MSRVLIFGGDGILGSHLYLTLRKEHEVALTLHGEAASFPQKLFSNATVFTGVAAGDMPRLAEVIDLFRPDWVVNAVGLVKRPLAADAVAGLEANTLFPHLLAKLCADRSIRLLHFSTDCVFSGARGMYSEQDLPDNTDWHGRCKALGEPSGEHVLVFRTSFIGLELSCKKSLLEWFLAQPLCVPGYRKAIWSGFPAAEVGRVAVGLFAQQQALNGLWHLSAPAISKYELLVRLNERLGNRGVTVFPDDSFVCDRSLDGSAFAEKTGYSPPSWDSMLDELATDIRSRWAGSAPSYWAD